MKRYVTAATFAIAAMVAFASPIQLASKPESYWPVTKGTELQYEDDCRDVSTHVVTSVDERMGEKLVSVSQEFGGQVTKRWVIRVSKDGLYQVERKDGKIVASLCLLKLPAKIGDSWEVFSDYKDLPKIKGTAKIVSIKDLKVPAGTFHAVGVLWKYELNGKPTERTFWYAPNVGLVKIQAANNTGVLKSFTLK